MNPKAVLLIVVIFIIWAEYEELPNILAHPEEAASSTAKSAPGSEYYNVLQIVWLIQSLTITLVHGLFWSGRRWLGNTYN